MDLYTNESLTFDRSVLMKVVRDKLRDFDKNLPKDDQMKAKILCHHAACRAAGT